MTIREFQEKVVGSEPVRAFDVLVAALNTETNAGALAGLVRSGTWNGGLSVEGRVMLQRVVASMSETLAMVCCWADMDLSDAMARAVAEKLQEKSEQTAREGVY